MLDASALRQNRLRRYKNGDVSQRIFDEIVRQAMAKGLVGGKILYSDSTHLKDAHGKKPLKFDGDKVKKQRAEEKENYFDYDSQGGNASGGSDEVKTVKVRTTDPAADLCTEKVNRKASSILTAEP